MENAEAGLRTPAWPLNSESWFLNSQFSIFNSQFSLLTSGVGPYAARRTSSEIFPSLMCSTR
jgi:hypothetical protein